MDADAFELARKQSELCRVFGNARRILIIWTLKDREMSVSEIASVVDSSLQNTSQHLRLMRDKGILTSRRDGNNVYYRIQQNESMVGCRLLLLTQQQT